MTKKQFATFASAMRTYYPKETLFPTEQALTLWYNQLNDIPYNVAETFLNKWVATNKWSPAISDIREGTTALTNGDFKEWGDAWEETLKAISKYGSYDEPKAMDSLDEVTRRVVKRLGYRNLCFSQEIQVERANFRMIYEQEIAKHKKEAQLPPTLKQIIKDMPQMIEGGET